MELGCGVRLLWRVVINGGGWMGGVWCGVGVVTSLEVVGCRSVIFVVGYGLGMYLTAILLLLELLLKIPLLVLRLLVTYHDTRH